MSYWTRFFAELRHLFQQITELPAWMWLPLYGLAVSLLAALALGLHP